MLIAFVCSMFTDGHPPPASKQAVKDLPTVKTSAEQQGCFLLHFRYCFYLLIYIYILRPFNGHLIHDGIANLV